MEILNGESAAKGGALDHIAFATSRVDELIEKCPPGRV